MQANADLILAFEALEAVRATYYARKEKTTFVINDYSLVPIYASLFNIPYLTMSEIIKRIKPFAKEFMFSKSLTSVEKSWEMRFSGTQYSLASSPESGYFH